ncbi:MAG: IS66 family transposase [Nanoarchaeota archaeon]|nr:IS66 family transposase [Nanoarchaeota archaeon]
MNEKEIELLKKENRQLKEENRKLKQEKHKIEYEKHKIEDEKHKIEKEFEEFKLKHAGTVDELKKAMHLKPNLAVKKKGRGAQKGHKAYTRRIPERIDHIKELKEKHCHLCGEKLSDEVQEVRSRYVTDIYFVAKIKTTRYNIHRKYCKKCKKIIEPEVPNVLPHARLGLNFMLFIMYLRIGMRLPVNKIQEFLQTVFGIHISQGEIILIGYQLARAFGPYYKNLEHILKIAKVKYTDTTSWRTEAKNYTAWVFITVGVVLYKITRRGKAEIPLKLFGKKQQGNVLVVDRSSTNRCLAKKAGFTLQFCWPHILDDSRGLAKNFGREGKYIHKKLKLIFADAKSLEHQGTEAQVKKLEGRIIALTKKRYKHSTVRKWVKNLAVRDLHGLFIFVTNPDVDPTNNISERKLRKLVMHRKTSNGSRSVAGANSIAVLYSVVETLKHQDKPIFPGLKQILTSRT